jgi:hypothetical protein
MHRSGREMREPFEWRKSSYSSTGANCVEIAWVFPVVWVRDNKDVTKPPLHMHVRSWEHFRRVICAAGEDQDAAR